MTLAQFWASITTETDRYSTLRPQCVVGCYASTVDGSVRVLLGARL
jgi:hypothetical protein